MVGALDNFRISLDVIGDDVNPDEISSVLGAQPTSAYRKGDAIHGDDGAFHRNAKTGRWSIKATSRNMRDPDFDTCLRELLESLTGDLNVWRQLSDRFDTGLFCGIFLTDLNRGFTLSAGLMAELSARELYLGLDVYGPDLPQNC